MSGKSLNYWRNRFNFLDAKWGRKEPIDCAPPDWFDHTNIFWMLCEYSSSSYSGLWGVTGGGSWNRFWSGRWNTHYGDDVRSVLVPIRKLPLEQQTVNKLVSLLKIKLDGKLLHPNGDLSRILKVVEEKTGVTLENCDARNEEAEQLNSTSFRS